MTPRRVAALLIAAILPALLLLSGPSGAASRSTLAATVWPSRVRQPSPRGCQYVIPGNADHSCEWSDPSVNIESWLVPDGRIQVVVCARPERYGEQIVMQLVWRAYRQIDRYQPIAEAATPVMFAPSSAAPCLPEILIPAATPDGAWVPDARRLTPLATPTPTATRTPSPTITPSPTPAPIYRVWLPLLG